MDTAGDRLCQQNALIYVKIIELLVDINDFIQRFRFDANTPFTGKKSMNCPKCNSEKKINRVSPIYPLSISLQLFIY
ncbi:hypothetical protein Barb7_00190 [Bacteroidales bacterium Barb7]|nr:hypothetical protein Barb7_00190 [Bacteroidales bacterium Barb7]